MATWAICFKIYALLGPIRDPCTRAHGKLVTPLSLVRECILLGYILSPKHNVNKQDFF